MAQDIAPELVERMAALVRQIAAAYTPEGNSRRYMDEGDEARAIAALLLKPVDPDLIEAREIAARDNEANAPNASQMVRDGRCDDSPIVTCALAGIKRGRELANPETSHG